jgi:hypothetical protein
VKDLAQAQALIAVLIEDRPSELEDAYRTARESGPKWHEAVERSLKQRPEIERLVSGLS